MRLMHQKKPINTEVGRGMDLAGKLIRHMLGWTVSFPHLLENLAASWSVLQKFSCHGESCFSG